MTALRFRALPAMVPGKTDCFMADPRKVVVDPDYNCRDMNSVETLAHIDWLAEEIESQGFNPEMPLTVKRRGDDIIVLRGHCRLAACLKLIAKGIEIVGVPVMQIASGTSDIDLLFDQESSNYGLRLDPLARARLVRKALRFGVKEEEIATRMHWKSIASVKQHLEMLELPEEVKEHVRNNDVSATTALAVVKNLPKGTDPKLAAEIIAANKEENRRLGVGKRHKTKTKVTRKTLQRDNQNAKPKSDSNNGAGLSVSAQTQAVAPEIEKQFSDLPTNADGVFASEPAGIEGTHFQTVTFPPDQIAETFAAPMARATTRMDRAIETLAIFAKHAEESCVNERPDDYVVEIPASDLKRAWRDYQAVAGDS